MRKDRDFVSVAGEGGACLAKPHRPAVVELPGQWAAGACTGDAPALTPQPFSPEHAGPWAAGHGGQRLAVQVDKASASPSGRASAVDISKQSLCPWRAHLRRSASATAATAAGGGDPGIRLTSSAGLTDTNQPAGSASALHSSLNAPTRAAWGPTGAQGRRPARPAYVLQHRPGVLCSMGSARYAAQHRSACSQGAPRCVGDAVRAACSGVG
jgi:hypothetical protein